MLYIINGDNFIRYEAKINNDSNLYNDIIDILEKNSISSHKDNENNETGIFKIYSGRRGNKGYINKDISLEIRNGFFIYSRNNIEYHIFISAYDLDDYIRYRILMRMRRESEGYIRRRLKDYLDH